MDAEDVIFTACLQASKESLCDFVRFLEARGVHVAPETVADFERSYYDNEHSTVTTVAHAATPQQQQQPQPQVAKAPTRVRVKKQKLQPNTMAHADVLGTEEYLL